MNPELELAQVLHEDASILCTQRRNRSSPLAFFAGIVAWHLTLVLPSQMRPCLLRLWRRSLPGAAPDTHQDQGR